MAKATVLWSELVKPDSVNVGSCALAYSGGDTCGVRY